MVGGGDGAWGASTDGGGGDGDGDSVATMGEDGGGLCAFPPVTSNNLVALDPNEVSPTKKTLPASASLHAPLPKPQHSPSPALSKIVKVYSPGNKSTSSSYCA